MGVHFRACPSFITYHLHVLRISGGRSGGSLLTESEQLANPLLVCGVWECDCEKYGCLCERADLIRRRLRNRCINYRHLRLSLDPKNLLRRPLTLGLLVLREETPYCQKPDEIDDFDTNF